MDRKEVYRAIATCYDEMRVLYNVMALKIDDHLETERIKDIITVLEYRIIELKAELYL